jgi:hypothetical protein
LPIHSLKGLREISIDGDCPKYNDEIFDSLAKVIAASQLTSIDVGRNWSPYRRPVSKNQTLHHIFKYCFGHHAALRLRHLSLKNWLIRLDDVTLPHLAHLTSLELIQIIDPDRPYQPNSEAISPVMQRYGSSTEEVWKTLGSSGIHLKELRVDAVTPSFLEFLSSCSGLKRLRISPLNFTDGKSSDGMAQKFFTMLDSHCHSLEELEISPPYEGLWCFGEHNLSIISQCTKLSHLCMAIISSHLNESSPESDAIVSVSG